MSAELLTKETLQERQGGVWDYVSPSRLGLWLKCPLAFKLRYHDGFVTPTSANQFIGRAVHKALESFYRHRLIGVRLSTAAVTSGLVADWDEMADEEYVYFKDAAHEGTCRNQAVALVSAYLGQLAADEPRPLAVEVAAEAPLVDPATGENLGLPMVGIMDLVLAEQEGPLIADFKTAARGDPRDSAHLVQLLVSASLTRARRCA